MLRKLWGKGYVLFTIASNTTTQSLTFGFLNIKEKSIALSMTFLDHPIRVKWSSIKLEKTSRNSLPYCWQLNILYHHQHCFEISFFSEKTVSEKEKKVSFREIWVWRPRHINTVNNLNKFVSFQMNVFRNRTLQFVIKKLRNWFLNLEFLRNDIQAFFRGIRVWNL